MNHESVNKLTLIKSEINKKILSLNFNDYFPNIIAVSKTFPLHIIEPLIQNGHTHFGENKVQEALIKWESIKQKNNLKPKIFLQINIGNEEQKSGVSLNNLKELYELSVKDFNLNVIGLMCLPPENKDPKEYFSKTKQLNDELKLGQLSMGMSGDYLKAIEFKSTYLRIGSKIFGERN